MMCSVALYVSDSVICNEVLFKFLTFLVKCRLSDISLRHNEWIDLWEQENSPRQREGTVNPESALEIIRDTPKVLLFHLYILWFHL